MLFAVANYFRDFLPLRYVFSSSRNLILTFKPDTEDDKSVIMLRISSFSSDDSINSVSNFATRACKSAIKFSFAF